MKTRFVQALLVLGTLVLAAQAEIATSRGQPNSADVADLPEHGVGSFKSSRTSGRKSQDLPYVAAEPEPSFGSQKPQHSGDEYINLKYSVESRLAEIFQDADQPAEVPPPAEPEVPDVPQTGHHDHEAYEHRYKHGVVPARLPAQENDHAHRFRHSIVHGYGQDIHA